MNTFANGTGERVLIVEDDPSTRTGLAELVQNWGFQTDEAADGEEALRRVNADSRLGWEAELQYFYRPIDVLERLLSLDAIVDPAAN